MPAKKRQDPIRLEDQVEAERMFRALRDGIRSANSQLAVLTERREQLVRDLSKLADDFKGRLSSSVPDDGSSDECPFPPPAKPVDAYFEREAYLQDRYASPAERERDREISTALRRIIPMAERIALLEEERLLSDDICAREAAAEARAKGDLTMALKIEERCQKRRYLSETIRSAMDRIGWTLARLDVDSDLRRVDITYPAWGPERMAQDLPRFRAALVAALDVPHQQKLRFFFTAIQSPRTLSDPVLVALDVHKMRV